MRNETFTLKGCIAKHETDAAILVVTEDEEHWIPFSQIEEIIRYPGNVADIRMTMWIARQKGLI